MKKLLRLIGNEEYRKWLEEYSELLDVTQYLHLIFAAPIDINEKLKLLNETRRRREWISMSQNILMLPAITSTPPSER